MNQSNSIISELTDTDANDFVSKNKVCIIDIFAGWCGTCRLFYPTFEKAAAENKEFSFAKIDGEKNPNFSSLIGPESIPYVAVFVEGQLVGGKVCSKKETLDEMLETIRTNLGSS